MDGTEQALDVPASHWIRRRRRLAMSRWMCGIAVGGFLVLAGVANAQEGQPTTREETLERLVEKLSQQVERLERRLDTIDGSKGVPKATGGPIQSRMAALEKSLGEMKRTAAPSVDAEEWARMRKVMERFSQGSTLWPHWKGGLHLDSQDGMFKLKIGGRIQTDWSFFGADDEIERTVGPLEDGTEFRRARMYVSGTVYDNIEFKAQFDFAGGEVEDKDLYIGLRKLPVVGNFRVGHFKEPFGLEEIGSSNNMTFMERDSASDAFAPFRNSGFMIHDTMLDKRMTWAVGAFRETDGLGFGEGGRDYNFTGRLTGVPLYKDKGRELVHLGVSYTHKNFGDDSVRFRARPESHKSPRFVDTGEFRAQYADIVLAEAAWVHGPFSLQGEYTQAFVQSRVMEDPAFWGAYVQASYFLTGEHRPYSLSKAVFGKLKPKHNYDGKGGKGAWEVAARYSQLDLNDARIKGGEIRNFTLGLNWYLNPATRVMWNYIRSDRTSGGSADILQMRFQFVF